MAKCSIQGCAGEYEDRTITHTVRHEGELMVIDSVPAEVCDVCGDVLFAPETVRELEEILRSHTPPSRTVPVYEYGERLAG